MERITKPNHNFNVMNIIQGLNNYTEIDEIMNLLSAYEDTGFSPEEIKDHEEMFKAYRHVCGGDSPEEIASLKSELDRVKAERDALKQLIPHE